MVELLADVFDALFDVWKNMLTSWVCWWFVCAFIANRLARKHDEKALWKSFSEVEEEELKFEIRCITAAFELEDVEGYKEVRGNWHRPGYGGVFGKKLWICSEGFKGSTLVSVALRTKEWFEVTFSHPDGFSEFWSIDNYRESPSRLWSPTTRHIHDVLRALYCLGADTRSISADYNVHLSSHEELELRLSLPRKFWPKMWLVEEL